MRDLALRADLAEYGLHFPDTAVMPEAAQMRRFGSDYRVAMDAHPEIVDGGLRLALDAQPGLITAPNAGIPSFLTNVIDPEVVRILVAPMRAVEILGETKKGDWTTLSAQFPTAESAGHVSSYGDYNNNGNIDVNMNWTPRQSYHYQSIKRYGERWLAMWGKAAVNGAAELDRAAALVFSKFQNRSYFFGISGLQNYGLLNDPSLIAPITPAVKAAGGTAWTNATAAEVYSDVLALYSQLQAQMGFNIDMSDPITLVLSNNRRPALSKVSQFNVTAETTIMQNFPNLTIKTAPEYSTTGGELMQMILPNYDGIQTGYGAFTEKMRAHPLIAELSAWMQKLSAGTWGAIIRRPTAIAQMLGI